jgi:hypothetical protein
MLDNPLNDLSQLLYPLSTLVLLSRTSPYRHSRRRASPGNPFASFRQRRLRCLGAIRGRKLTKKDVATTAGGNEVPSKRPGRPVT